jgi:hypothetical protein
MIVVRLRIDWFITAGAVAELVFKSQTGFAQQFQGSVHRCLADAGFALSDDAVKLFQVMVAPHILKNFRDPQPLARDVKPPRVHEA